MTGTRHMGKTTRVFLSLVVLALLALTLQSVVFSGANLTRTSTNPGNVFTAGTLTHTNSASGQVVLNATGLAPGQSQSGTLTITGGGSLSGIYTLSKSTLVDTPSASGLSSALTLQVQDVTGTATTLYSATVAAFTSVSMGTIAPGATRTYKFTVTFPTAAATPALQGATSRLALLVTGSSS